MTVRILVTSDTHLTIGARLPDGLLRLADRADHVIHAGDLVRMDVFDTLATLAPVTAVVGNVDDAEVASQLPDRATVTLDGITFGVVHDGGGSNGRHERLRGWFPGASVIVFGHSHMPELATLEDGTMIINPGSPTQRRRAPRHTAVWMELEDGTIAAADLVHLD
ncbi:MAG: Phosphoesterase [Thermoleophilia bacterium]|nr:Phosphoesterase [Thermoleophilia bacterium]